ncbi:hypothetical protein LTR50_000186 [Elasticomyces elasticus]|nr:hypothetical protein LTR50_000186 [Elasticomyces elasticus]
MAVQMSLENCSDSPANHTTQNYCGSPIRQAQQDFEDLDDTAVLDRFQRILERPETRNFVVGFADDQVRVASDLDLDVFKDLLHLPRSEGLTTRWINIWHPFQHVPFIEAIAKSYDFSPRLLALMCSDPQGVRPPLAALPCAQPTSSTSTQNSAPSIREHVDLEKGTMASKGSSISSLDAVRSGNLYDIVDEVWHYSSVDWGRSFITINEDPWPHNEGRLDALQQRTLLDIRRNLLNVFRSLSKVDRRVGESPLTLLPIRQRVGDTLEETVHRSSDAPGLLFYYLFENWYNSYTLVTRQESQYGVELSQLREDMFRKPELQHIDRLDQISCQLGVLKRLYASYERIINRVLEQQTATPASLANSKVVSEASRESLRDPTDPKLTEAESMLGVSLSSAARVRFERLKDLINLYAVSEIQEYLHQKDSLVAMNFNLIAIKESRDVERLTRVALLLTKITILFLPVSLMSAYFGLPLQSVAYTTRMYWISFAVILVLSWVTLVAFGLISGTMETTTGLQPLQRLAGRLFGKMRREKNGGREVGFNE